jgi:hypothetical protein
MAFCKIKNLFRKAVTGINNLLDSEKSRIEEWTEGKNIPPEAIEAMQNKGWEICIKNRTRQATTPVICTQWPIYRDYIFTDFTARKGPHEKGSKEWYRDLYDASGLDYKDPPSRTQQPSPEI